MQFTLPRIYPITDKRLANRADHYSIVKELVKGGARCIQIRDKSTPLGALLPDLRRCIDLARQNDVLLIINDRCDLALSIGATGVHLGQDDIPPEAARAILGPDRIIGFSTHSLLQVQKSRPLPVQYIGFGPIYPTSTKNKSAPEVGLTQLRRACRESPVPVVAIGGIGLDRIAEVLKTGAASAAVISALMQATDLSGQMKRFLERAMET